MTLLKKVAAFCPGLEPVLKKGMDNAPCDDFSRSFWESGVCSNTNPFNFSTFGFMVSLIFGQSSTRFLTCIEKRATNPRERINNKIVLIREAQVLLTDLFSIFRLRGKTSKARTVATAKGARNGFAFMRPAKRKYNKRTERVE